MVPIKGLAKISAMYILQETARARHGSHATALIPSLVVVRAFVRVSDTEVPLVLRLS